MSPVPTSVDVNDSDREGMAGVIQSKDGHKLFLALATGTEDNPADINAPKYFVASNLPEGANVTLSVAGVPGTLVNRVGFEKTFTAAVDKSHIAVFDKISDEGKPLWGEFTFKVTADGADALDGGKRFIGNKGAAYQKRLKTYKDSVQGDYDKEIADLREYITTVKSVQVDASKEIANYKGGWAAAGLRSKITTDWLAFTKSSQPLLAQLEASIKSHMTGDKQPKFHTRAFQDLSTTVGQLQQLVKAHSDRLSGIAPTANADELEGLVQASVLALETWLAQAVAKSPFDSHSPEVAAKAPASASGSVARPSAAPAAGAPAAKTVPATGGGAH
jgi:hypothetical protein